jgi:hypothetical protein
MISFTTIDALQYTAVFAIPVTEIINAPNDVSAYTSMYVVSKIGSAIIVGAVNPTTVVDDASIALRIIPENFHSADA